MAQLGFLDADKRLEALSAKGDPLEAIVLVSWESFRAEIEAVGAHAGLAQEEHGAARAKIGLQNLAYNIRRLVTERLAAT